MPPFNLQEIKPVGQTFLQMQILAELRKCPQNKGGYDTSRMTTKHQSTLRGIWALRPLPIASRQWRKGALATASARPKNCSLENVRTLLAPPCPLSGRCGASRNSN